MTDRNNYGRRYEAAVASAATVLLAAGGLSGALIAPAHAQDAPSPSSFPDVPANHWAYRSVTDLAAKGYVKGYPDGKFLGQRALTRYEFAMVIERMLQTITELNARIGASPTAPPTTPTGAFATQEDLAKLQTLVDAFKPQLDTLTADVAALKGAGYQAQIDALRRDVVALKADIAKAQAAAARAYGFGPGKFQLLGYVQARYTKVTSGDQIAYPNGTTAVVGGPASVNGNYAVGGNNMSFFVRRARLKATGGVTDNTRYAIQIDAANLNGVTPISVKEGNLSYTFGNGDMTRHATVTAGQFATFFGLVLPASAAEYFTPERPLPFNEGASGLFQNQDYDRGVALSMPFGGFRASVGVINGTGTTLLADKRRPDEIYRLAYQTTAIKGFKTVGIGASYYNGEVSRSIATNPAGEPAFTGLNYNRLHKGLGGADISLTTACGIYFQSEYVGGRFDERSFISALNPSGVGKAIVANAYAPDNQVRGFYAQTGYTLKPASAHPIGLGLNYEELDRSRSVISAAQEDQYGNAIAGGASGGSFTDANYSYGGTYMLDKQTRFRLWYDQPTKVAHAATIASPKKIGLLTAELQVRF
jgi:hypothetical protein